MKVYLLLLVVLLGNAGICLCQGNGIAAIDDAISHNNAAGAIVLIEKRTNDFIRAGKPDSILQYIFYVGKTWKQSNDATVAITKVNQFIDRVKSITTNLATIRQAYIEAGEFFGSIGKNTLGYAANQEALRQTMLIPGYKQTDVARIESNLGAFAQRMGDIEASKNHHRKALQILEAQPNRDHERTYITYNSMGGIMWYASKLDSARYFFDKALAELKQTDQTPTNQYYRPAMLLNNLAGVYSMEGQATKAISAMKSTIENLKKFLATKEANIKKESAVTFQFEATDNLAGIYKELGDFTQAKALLEYSYAQKQQHLDKNDPGIFISQILIGQIYYALYNYDKALEYLDMGLKNIAKADGDYTYWQADASQTLALIYDQQKQVSKAALYYEKADSLYQETFGGDYDNIYLDFLRNKALFYAENEQPAKAIASADKSYAYALKNQGPNTLEVFYQQLNLSNIYHVLGKYSQALQFSKQAITTVDGVAAASNNLLDSIKIELKKPKAILLNAKARYALLPNKTVATLTPMLNGLNEALALLERRKALINDPENIAVLLAEHNELLEFTKQVTIDLYQLTSNAEQLDQLMNLQESGLYTRIRSRLDKNDTLLFANVPLEVQAKEKSLKAAITASLQSAGGHGKNMQQYFGAVRAWETFQQQLKTQYHTYFKLRYASLVQSLGQLQTSIPDNTTLLRYFFINKTLYAFVADRTIKKVYRLTTSNLQNNIDELLQPGLSAQQTSKLTSTLYQQLWAPLITDIKHQQVIILPDGPLYKLSFELLTPLPITSFKQLATNSLLARHTLSYNYSLFLINQTKPIKATGNFIAFAPGFLNNKAQSSTTDPLETNVAYASLLPQPFTLSLVQKIKLLFGGNAYVNKQSTKQNFKANAGNHTIVHIGTHAESNSDYPEYSKLIFANSNASQGDNELFAHEIYNCNVNTALTVLTACETGKAGYQYGEGMISLAHAFNYAGSQSIITGLWKIDEQASALLMELFYKNLLGGMRKDEALRQAKLQYLLQSNGRMLTPAFWAGLVIMGDTSPVVIQQHNTYYWVIAIAVLLFMSVFFIIASRRKKLL